MATAAATLEEIAAAFLRELDRLADGMRERRVPGATSARLDVPLGGKLRAYRIGRAVMWDRWLAAVEERRPPAEARTGLLGAASRHRFDDTDRRSTYIAELYSAERERLLDCDPDWMELREYDDPADGTLTVASQRHDSARLRLEPGDLAAVVLQLRRRLGGVDRDGEAPAVGRSVHAVEASGRGLGPP
jgi:hypothetical protein